MKRIFNKLINFQNSSHLEYMLKILLLIPFGIIYCLWNVILFLLGFRTCNKCNKCISPFEKRYRETETTGDYTEIIYYHNKCKERNKIK